MTLSVQMNSTIILRFINKCLRKKRGRKRGG